MSIAEPKMHRSVASVNDDVRTKGAGEQRATARIEHEEEGGVFRRSSESRRRSGEKRVQGSLGLTYRGG